MLLRGKWEVTIRTSQASSFISCMPCLDLSRGLSFIQQICKKSLPSPYDVDPVVE